MFTSNKRGSAYISNCPSSSEGWVYKSISLCSLFIINKNRCTMQQLFSTNVWFYNIYKDKTNFIRKGETKVSLNKWSSTDSPFSKLEHSIYSTSCIFLNTILAHPCTIMPPCLLVAKCIYTHSLLIRSSLVSKPVLNNAGARGPPTEPTQRRSVATKISVLQLYRNYTPFICAVTIARSERTCTDKVSPHSTAMCPYANRQAFGK